MLPLARSQACTLASARWIISTVLEGPIDRCPADVVHLLQEAQKEGASLPGEQVRSPTLSSGPPHRGWRPPARACPCAAPRAGALRQSTCRPEMRAHGLALLVWLYCHIRWSCPQHPSPRLLQILTSGVAYILFAARIDLVPSDATQLQGFFAELGKCQLHQGRVPVEGVRLDRRGKQQHPRL